MLQVAFHIPFVAWVKSNNALSLPLCFCLSESLFCSRAHCALFVFSFVVVAFCVVPLGHDCRSFCLPISTCLCTYVHTYEHPTISPSHLSQIFPCSHHGIRQFIPYRQHCSKTIANCLFSRVRSVLIETPHRLLLWIKQYDKTLSSISQDRN